MDLAESVFCTYSGLFQSKYVKTKQRILAVIKSPPMGLLITHNFIRLKRVEST